jgi:hypothetical protein
MFTIAIVPLGTRFTFYFSGLRKWEPPVADAHGLILIRAHPRPRAARLTLLFISSRMARTCSSDFPVVVLERPDHPPEPGHEEAGLAASHRD